MYSNILVVLPDVAAKFDATRYQAYKQKKCIDTRYINTCIAKYIKQLFDNNYIFKINEEDECKKEGASPHAKSFSHTLDRFQVPLVYLRMPSCTTAPKPAADNVYKPRYIWIRI